jgi:hypothetical protein
MKNNENKNRNKSLALLAILVVPIVVSIFFIPSCGTKIEEGTTTTTGAATTANIPPRVHIDPPAFNADSAYNFIKIQCDMGPRNPGSSAHERCVQWIKKKMESYGARVTIQTATIATYDEKRWTNKNIIAEFNPDVADRILLVAHYDSRHIADHDSIPGNRNRPILGANDGASGVAVIMEMARAFSQKRTTVGVDVLFDDLEDYGDPDGNTEDSWCLGTQYWTKNLHRPQYFARFGILLDIVGGKNATFAKEGTSIQYAGTVLDKVWSKAQEMGYGNYFVEQRLQAITDDHVYINQNTSIPTIDIIQHDLNGGSFFPCHHKQCDDMSGIDKKTLEAVGKVVLEIIYNE